MRDERCQGVEDIIKFIKTEFQEGGHMNNVIYRFKSASKRFHTTKSVSNGKMNRISSPVFQLESEI